MNALNDNGDTTEQGKKKMAESPISKIEQRMWSILISVALAFGGIWLQNQYNTTIKLQEQLTEYMRFVDEKYLEAQSFREHAGALAERLNRIEDKLDVVIQKDNTTPAPPTLGNR